MAIFLTMWGQAAGGQLSAWHLIINAGPMVKFVLLVTGRQQTSPCGFSGDPDTYPERLLWLGPASSC